MGSLHDPQQMKFKHADSGGVKHGCENPQGQLVLLLGSEFRSKPWRKSFICFSRRDGDTPGFRKRRSRAFKIILSTKMTLQLDMKSTWPYCKNVSKKLK